MIKLSFLAYQCLFKQELLGHCLDQLKHNERKIEALESQLQDVGSYEPFIFPPQVPTDEQASPMTAFLKDYAEMTALAKLTVSVYSFLKALSLHQLFLLQTAQETSQNGLETGIDGNQTLGRLQRKKSYSSPGKAEVSDLSRRPVCHDFWDESEYLLAGQQDWCWRVDPVREIC